MTQWQSSKLLEIFDKIVYLFLLSLGIYFINEGDTIDKYRKHRTNFAESEENLSELPTILTHIQYHNNASHCMANLQFERDFNISYKVVGSEKETNLSQGDNLVVGSGLRVKLAVQNEYSKYHEPQSLLTDIPETRQVIFYSWNCCASIFGSPQLAIVKEQNSSMDNKFAVSTSR